ncbi:MAG: ATP-binding protein [Fidelibacterota bacterium]
MNNYQLILTNSLDQLDMLPSTLEQLEKEWQLPPDLTMNLNLVLEEIFTNIVNYGFRDTETHDIHLNFQYDKEEITITISDDGIPFNPLKAVKPPDLNAGIEDTPVGGLGFHIVRKLMDKIDYKRENNKNHLILSKEVPS